MFWRVAPSVGLLAVLPLMAAGQTPQEPSVFRSGTHLVQVEVVVRDKNGPVKGLTKDDFTLLDQGEPEAIAIFRAGSASDAKLSPLPAGAVSNRRDSRGQPLNGATVVLFDQLNTGFDFKAYERGQTIKLLRSLSATDRIAFYALGKDLHILQDFTDDPRKLIEAVVKMDQGLDRLPVDLEEILGDSPDAVSLATDGEKRFAGLEAQVNARIDNQITVEALSRIILHLSGIPGRKNLVWLKEQPQVPPQVIAMAQLANVALYPVLVRTVLYTSPDIFAPQHAVQDLAAATGGAGFVDAGDLTAAVRTAVEDTNSAYVLGYYPSEKMLDGRFHRLTVKLADRGSEVSYRPGYLATKIATPVPLPPDQDQFENPLDLTGIGLTAQVRADPARPQRQLVQVTVDLNDIHLEHQDGLVTGAFKLWLLFPASHSIRSWMIQVNLSDEQFTKALETGYIVDAGGLERQTGEFRVMVRDRTTGATGSLRIPAGNE